MRILFVCTGNLCRSPVAERLAVAWAGQSLAGSPELARIHVGSAGLAAVTGQPMERHSAAVADQFYRFAIGITPGTTNSNGRLKFAHFLGDSTTIEQTKVAGSGTAVSTVYDANNLDLNGDTASTVYSFYWGKTIEESEQAGDMTGAIVAAWLKVFRERSPYAKAPEPNH